MDDFETFARDKISRLRAEAESLERTLKEYQAAMGRAVRASGSGEGRAPGGAFGAVLDALAAVGPNGMSLDEMMEAAEVAGFNMNRNTLRSQLYTAKGKGQVEPLEAGRYRAPRQPEEEKAAGEKAPDALKGFLSSSAPATVSAERQPRPWDRPPAPRADDDIPF